MAKEIAQRCEMYYYALNDYLKNKYGRKIYKIALDAGRTICQLQYSNPHLGRLVFT